MLSLVPSFKLEEQKTELIFVVDRSGSMQGQGIQQAKQALTVRKSNLFYSTPRFFNILVCCFQFLAFFAFPSD